MNIYIYNKLPISLQDENDQLEQFGDKMLTVKRLVFIQLDFFKTWWIMMIYRLATGHRLKKKMYTSESALQDLKDKYKNPLHPISFLGVEKIYKFYNGVLHKNKIRRYLNSTEVSTIMRLQPRNRPKIFAPIISFHHLDLVQMDLIDVSRLSSENDGYNFLFCVIDVFSRLLYVQPLKNKQALSVMPALKTVLLFMEHLPTNH